MEFWGSESQRILVLLLLALFFALLTVVIVILLLLRSLAKTEKEGRLLNLFLARLELKAGRFLRRGDGKYYLFTDAEGTEWVLYPIVLKKGPVTVTQATEWAEKLAELFPEGLSLAIVVNQAVAPQIEDDLDQKGIHLFSITTPQDIPEVLAVFFD